ncbi:MAG TPA: hypothetical protein VE076_05365 [Nitrososphaeraceae archaeon]|nr:hypothetical protein [Nitrososphaeraceae archaeon]
MNKSLNFAVIGIGLLATVLAVYMIAATNLAAAQGGNMSSAGGGNMSSAGGGNMSSAGGGGGGNMSSAGK